MELEHCVNAATVVDSKIDYTYMSHDGNNKSIID